MQTTVWSNNLPVEVWHNHTYNNALLTSMKNVLEGIGQSCFLIPKEGPFMFLVDKEVPAGDVIVNVQGARLDCVSSTCPGESLLVLQTESSCINDGRSPFCGHPERCILSTYNSKSCTFTCKCEPAARPRVCNIRIAVYFRFDGKPIHRETSEVCGFNVNPLFSWGISGGALL